MVENHQHLGEARDGVRVNGGHDGGRVDRAQFRHQLMEAFTEEFEEAHRVVDGDIRDVAAKGDHRRVDRLVVVGANEAEFEQVGLKLGVGGYVAGRRVAAAEEIEILEQGAGPVREEERGVLSAAGDACGCAEQALADIFRHLNGRTPTATIERTTRCQWIKGGRGRLFPKAFRPAGSRVRRAFPVPTC